LLGLLLLSGCDTERYPEDMTYPVRSDLLVVTAPTAIVNRPDPPGAWPATLKEVGLPTDEGGPGGAKLDPSKLSAEDRHQFQTNLLKLFGTPANPKVGDPNGELQQSLDDLQLGAAALQEGSRLYRRHCLHCHGMPGDGHGPTAPWVNPHPRDYRQGQFKFISSRGGNERKPRREDLLRTLRQGIDGTAMPPFGLLSDNELNALASYVIHLSLRGQTEFDAMATLLKEGKDSLEGGSIAEDLPARLAIYVGRWKDAEGNIIQPSGTPPAATDQASVERGYQLFRTGEASCISCHKDYGRAYEFRYDVWGTLVRPADLTRGVYRGGRRPIDLFWRVHSGIVPAAMPAFGKTDANAAVGLTDQQIWDVVNFVQALPYPQMLPPNIRDEVYGPPAAPAVASTER
jgi:mono/diheme cytochrome c family protein